MSMGASITSLFIRLRALLEVEMRLGVALLGVACTVLVLPTASAADLPILDHVDVNTRETWTVTEGNVLLLRAGGETPRNGNAAYIIGSSGRMTVLGTSWLRLPVELGNTFTLVAGDKGRVTVEVIEALHPVPSVTCPSPTPPPKRQLKHVFVPDRGVADHHAAVQDAIALEAGNGFALSSASYHGQGRHSFSLLVFEK